MEKGGALCNCIEKTISDSRGSGGLGAPLKRDVGGWVVYASVCTRVRVRVHTSIRIGLKQGVRTVAAPQSLQSVPLNKFARVQESPSCERETELLKSLTSLTYLDLSGSAFPTHSLELLMALPRPLCEVRMSRMLGVPMVRCCSERAWGWGGVGWGGGEEKADVVQEGERGGWGDSFLAWERSAEKRLVPA